MRRLAMQRERFQLAEARKHLVASMRVGYWSDSQLAYHADMYTRCLQTARNLRAARLAIGGAK